MLLPVSSNPYRLTKAKTMTYKQWSLLIKKELNRIAVDYVDPSGQVYSEPFCFYTLDEALTYGKMCIDHSIRLRVSSNTGIADVQNSAIS
jgi:hypothetical protein